MSGRIEGMPGALPPGEHILWQGRPAWWPLARRLCHVQAAGAYFILLAAGDAGLRWLDGGAPGDTLRAVAPLLLGGCAVVAFLLGLGWMVAGTTEYTLTTRRLVMRMGVALPAVLAIPHTGIARAGIRLDRDGTGDLPIETKPGYAIALHRVWPHSRPGRWRRAHPMLRSIPQAASVATLLARALATAEADRLRPAPAPVMLAAE